jgi:exodeoxyribonuclease VIII
MNNQLVFGQDFAVYRKIAAEHKSLLCQIEKSPAHYKCAGNNQPKPTTAQLIGSAVHCLVLEPERFEERYYVCSDKVRRGTKAWDSIEISANGREILKPDDFAEMLAMRDAVRAHPKACECLDACAAAEVSIFWRDLKSGLACKGRADSLSVEHRVILDLKTCQDASERGFLRDVVDYKYHWQAAMYCDGAKAVTGHDFMFVFIAVEKAPPYGVAVYLISEAFIAAGRKAYRDALNEVLFCMTNNTWPCYAEGAVEIQAPAWMEKAAQ